jgi:hypothetical protein
LYGELPLFKLCPKQQKLTFRWIDSKRIFPLFEVDFLDKTDLFIENKHETITWGGAGLYAKKHSAFP